MNYSLSELALLSRLLRWQNLPTIQSESVAEHTAQVALIVVKLHSFARFDLGRALAIAVLHDVAEIDLTDLPHNVTRRFSALAEAKRLAEAEVLANRLPDFADMLTKESTELAIVKLADTIQVCQFAKSELAISQAEAMQTVLSEATELALALAEQLDLTGFVQHLLGK